MTKLQRMMNNPLTIEMLRDRLSETIKLKIEHLDSIEDDGSCPDKTMLIEFIKKYLGSNINEMINILDYVNAIIEVQNASN